MKIRLVVALVGLAISFAVPTFAQQKDTADPKTAQQIRALTAKFNEAFNKHDPGAVAALYTEDAVWQTYHGTYFGRQRIEKVYADWCFKRWNKHNWVTTISRVIPVGNEVRATGIWSCDLGGGGADRGLCSWVLVHEGDIWRIHKETLSSDTWKN
jgi:uncharacterized protein (TIGR02246 family)